MSESMPNRYDSPLWSIVFNIIGGVLATFVYVGLQKLLSKLKARKFKILFGVTNSRFELVYGVMHLKSDTPNKFVYNHPDSSQYSFSSSAVISSSCAESIKYLIEAFTRVGLNGPELTPDNKPTVIGDVFSYCSIGGRNNGKSSVILDKNTFYKHYKKISRYDNSSNKFQCNSPSPGCDYALVIKLKNEYFSNISMICVAGLGELGTKGGAWFLSNKWNEIYSKVKDKEFGCIIRVSEPVHNSELIEYCIVKKGKKIYKNLVDEKNIVKTNLFQKLFSPKIKNSGIAQQDKLLLSSESHDPLLDERGSN